MEEAIFTWETDDSGGARGSKVILKACQDQEDLMAQAMAFASTFKKGRGNFGDQKNV
jgi:hypothetical protein